MILPFAPARPPAGTSLPIDAVRTVTDPTAPYLRRRLAWLTLCAQRGIRVHQHRLDWPQQDQPAPCAAMQADLAGLPDGDAA